MVKIRQHRVATVLACSVLALAAVASAQGPHRLSGDDVSPAICGVLEMPASPGPHPGVVLLHGAGGWRPGYARLARVLADSGFVVLALDYYSETGLATAPWQWQRMWPEWQGTVRGAVRWLGEQPSVSAQRIGLVGFSFGAFLAVSVASSMPSVKAVVDYYGGANTTTKSMEEQVRNFPPLLILHGEADAEVPIRYAHELSEAVTNNGGEVELHIYPGARHGFDGRFGPNYSEAAAVDSFRRTVEFLERRLTNR